MAKNDHVTEAFGLFDGDGDGHLLIDEAASAIRALGHVLPEADIKGLLKKYGVEGRKKCDLQTFRNIHGSLPQQDYNRQLDQALKTVDKEGKDFVMATELKHLLTNMGDKLSDEDFNGLLEELDIDANGRIQFKEFLRLLNSR